MPRSTELRAAPAGARPRLLFSRYWACCFSLSALGWAAPVRADLASDLHTLYEARARRGQVVHPKPRLLERGERLPLLLPAEFVDAKDASCTTVSILGVVGLHFVVHFSSFDPGAPSSAFPELSVTGASEVTRCGSGKPYLAGLVLEMRSPRGVVELLISQAKSGAPRLIEVLPGRDPGSELALGEPGPRPAQAPLAERIRRLTLRAERERASSFQLDVARAADDGRGSLSLALGAGCHELTLLNDTVAAAGAAVDLDMELVERDTGARIAIDRADDSDGMLGLCLGAPKEVELRFIGARPNAPLSLAHALWALPPGLPITWGEGPRARFAELARAQHLALLKAPIYSSLGVQGTTELPLEVDPGACYNVLLAPLRGEVRSLSVSAVARVPGQSPRGASDSEGGVVSFCAAGGTRAQLEVTADGVNLAWLLAVWESGRTALGVPSP